MTEAQAQALIAKLAVIESCLLFLTSAVAGALVMYIVL